MHDISKDWQKQGRLKWLGKWTIIVQKRGFCHHRTSIWVLYETWYQEDNDSGKINLKLHIRYSSRTLRNWIESRKFKKHMQPKPQHSQWRKPPQKRTVQQHKGNMSLPSRSGCTSGKTIKESEKPLTASLVAQGKDHRDRQQRNALRENELFKYYNDFPWKFHCSKNPQEVSLASRKSEQQPLTVPAAHIQADFHHQCTPSWEFILPATKLEEWGPAKQSASRKCFHPHYRSHKGSEKVTGNKIASMTMTMFNKNVYQVLLSS